MCSTGLGDRAMRYSDSNTDYRHGVCHHHDFPASTARSDYDHDDDHDHSNDDEDKGDGKGGGYFRRQRDDCDYGGHRREPHTVTSTVTDAQPHHPTTSPRQKGFPT